VRASRTAPAEAEEATSEDDREAHAKRFRSYLMRLRPDFVDRVLDWTPEGPCMECGKALAKDDDKRRRIHAPCEAAWIRHTSGQVK
jgi:hypothetical protein